MKVPLLICSFFLVCWICSAFHLNPFRSSQQISGHVLRNRQHQAWNVQTKLQVFGDGDHPISIGLSPITPRKRQVQRSSDSIGIGVNVKEKGKGRKKMDNEEWIEMPRWTYEMVRRALLQ